MYIVTHYTTDHSDADYVPAVVVATGTRLESVAPEITSAVSEYGSLGAAFDVADQYGAALPRDEKSLGEAIVNGTTCVVIDWGSHKDVFTVNVA